ncbi:plasmodesmata-located protein 8 [Punica granatum]|uniref:Gnk2-homologous domain-containing protein n=2 Tax=Punica granatum TaxID=22663 RepID=A0A218X5X6_PUNGR|nr:plasmodesmata-located protein 8 [Punica granatum]OWM80188.1 hypothetical protein CDL15_Pgr019352 [Punica granatum]PKI71802.1 hypothetical protein CRG98_007818 [Punica granatum]
MPRALSLLLSTSIFNVPSSLFILISIYHHARLSQAYNVFIYGGCSQEKYQPGPNSPMVSNLNSFLASVVSSSSQALYNSFAIGNGTSIPPEAAIYGLYQCRGDLKVPDCTGCIRSAVNQISLVCPYSYGAALQLEGCYVRYEHVNFLGQLDTSLRYKRCSKSSENDIEFFRRRDGVLADLKAANGFRVSSSGTVEGFVQCLWDLSPADCSSCLSEVVGQLKTMCGLAAAGDVFLGQCYGRYWASGYYDFSKDSSTTSNDQVGKAVAIIVGSVAGLAVLVVSLSICRKATG